jgi:hypothetical protein
VISSDQAAVSVGTEKLATRTSMVFDPEPVDVDTACPNSSLPDPAESERA